ncbi:hypothetical protein JQ624_28340 [Bradyrhizobium sp. AUGA SZCCT0283]|nr:hypothetical protein [Bradyrhizobium sp. AUGA SZCCT0283]
MVADYVSWLCSLGTAKSMKARTFGTREPALRHDHMHRQRGGLMAREHDFQFAVPHS